MRFTYAEGGLQWWEARRSVGPVHTPTPNIQSAKPSFYSSYHALGFLGLAFPDPTTDEIYQAKSQRETTSTSTVVPVEPPTSDISQPDKHFFEPWAWASTVAKVLATRIFEIFRYDPYTQRSCPISPTLITAALNCETQEVKTIEKAYRYNDCGRFLKRSLRQDEYHILSDGEPLVPMLVVERLQNEAACLSFIQQHTDIPIPKLLGAYEENGSYHLWTEFIDGVEMSKLTREKQAELFPQIQSIVATLQTLRSKNSGGPTGILSPPSMVCFDHLSKWEQQFSPNEDFVFCHGDLSQGNILVDRETLRVTAIIDWEYGGFFPREHELLFYKSPERSGTQVNGMEFRSVVDKMIEFWQQSQVSVSYESQPAST